MLITYTPQRPPPNGKVPRAVVAAADHRGYPLKDTFVSRMRAQGHDVTDAGTNGPESVDYPDLAVAVGEAIRRGEADRAILVCGSGVGAVIAANKLPGIRADLTHDTYSARQGVEHDDMNVICLGSKIIGEELAFEIVDAFLAARFQDEERSPPPPREGESPRAPCGGARVSGANRRPRAPAPRRALHTAPPRALREVHPRRRPPHRPRP